MKRRIIFCLCLILMSAFQQVLADSALDKELARTVQNNFSYIEDTSKYTFKLSKQDQEHFYQEFLDHFFSPWTNPYKYHSKNEIKKNLKRELHHFKNNPGLGQNNRKNTREWVQSMVVNMQLAEYPNVRRKAIILRNTSLRALPTMAPSFLDWNHELEGYPFDYLQYSTLQPNMPIYILQTTKDGAWYLVLSSYDVVGWVKSSDVAFVSESFIKRWRTANYIAPIEDNIAIKALSGRFYFKSRIGSVLPLQAMTKNAYRIYVAVTDQEGNAVIVSAMLKKTAARILPFSITAKNIALVANGMLDHQYGWGGLNNLRDCSSSIMDLYTPFAFWLPRNSRSQINAGTVISLRHLSDDAKNKKIIKEAIPFLTLIGKPGHIQMYIGQKNNMAHVFQNVWSLHYINPKTKQESGLPIGRTIISPLNLGHGRQDVRATWLRETFAMTHIIPPKLLTFARNDKG